MRHLILGMFLFLIGQQSLAEQTCPILPEVTNPGPGGQATILRDAAAKAIFDVYFTQTIANHDGNLDHENCIEVRGDRFDCTRMRVNGADTYICYLLFPKNLPYSIFLPGMIGVGN